MTSQALSFAKTVVRVIVRVLMRVIARAVEVVSLTGWLRWRWMIAVDGCGGSESITARQ